MTFHYQPILIAAMPRSGSSLTAGIFHQHGVWTGTSISTNKLNSKGFFENANIKDLMIRYFGKPTVRVEDCVARHNVDHSQLKKDILETVNQDGYTDKPWLMKFSCMYALDVMSAFPNSKVVTVYRNKESVWNSAVEKTKMLKAECFEEHYNTMETLENHFGAVRVEFDKLIEGDYSSIFNALYFCGVTPDREVIESFVDPELKNY